MKRGFSKTIPTVAQHVEKLKRELRENAREIFEIQNYHLAAGGKKIQELDITGEIIQEIKEGSLIGDIEIYEELQRGMEQFVQLPPRRQQELVTEIFGPKLQQIAEFYPKAMQALNSVRGQMQREESESAKRSKAEEEKKKREYLRQAMAPGTPFREMLRREGPDHILKPGYPKLAPVVSSFARSELRQAARMLAVPESRDSGRSELRQAARMLAVPESRDSGRSELRQAARMLAVPESRDSGRSELRGKTHEFSLEELIRSKEEVRVTLPFYFNEHTIRIVPDPNDLSRVLIYDMVEFPIGILNETPLALFSGEQILYGYIGDDPASVFDEGKYPEGEIEKVYWIIRLHEDGRLEMVNTEYAGWNEMAVERAPSRSELRSDSRESGTREQLGTRRSKLGALTGEDILAADKIDVSKMTIQGIQTVASLEGEAKINAIIEKNPVVLLIRSNTKVTRELIDRLPRLRAIVRLGHGIDNVDIPYAESKGIRVIASKGSAESVAALALRMIAAAKQKELGMAAAEDSAPEKQFLTIASFEKRLRETDKKVDLLAATSNLRRRLDPALFRNMRVAEQYASPTFHAFRQLLSEKISAASRSEMRSAPSVPSEVGEWVQKMAAFLGAGEIRWVDASDFGRLAEEAVQKGILFPTSDGNFYARSHPKDVARSENQTVVATGDPKHKGIYNNWRPLDEVRSEFEKKMEGSYEGKDLFVIPYLLGPVDSPYSQAGIEITDSLYVALNMILMTMVGDAALKSLEKSPRFIKGIHSTGDLNAIYDRIRQGGADGRLFASFPEAGEIWSYGSAYGGNALLAKKFHALRQASFYGWKEGWLAEHMLIVEIENLQDGEKHYIAAAFPSASGKTNFAMTRIARTLQGRYRAKVVGDDIAWLYPGKDGRLYAINPESGFFGVAPGTGSKTNPSMMETLKPGSRTIYTNVAFHPETGEVWWEGKTKEKPLLEGWLDWKGEPATASTEKWAHPNSRFTTSIENAPNLSEGWYAKQGVPISAIIWGGRVSRGEPLVRQLAGPVSGIYDGAMMGVLATAAAEGAEGRFREDPMAMRPFFAYPERDYFEHWLNVVGGLSFPPAFFHVNWFLQDENGGFIWPGFENNSRLLPWILSRIKGKTDGEGKAVETPAGFIPAPEALEPFIQNLNLSETALKRLLGYDAEHWRGEAVRRTNYIDAFRDKGLELPREILEAHERFREALLRSELRTGADAPVLQSAPRVDRAELRQAARMPAVPESRDSGRSELRARQSPEDIEAALITKHLDYRLASFEELRSAGPGEGWYNNVYLLQQLTKYEKAIRRYYQGFSENIETLIDYLYSRDIPALYAPQDPSLQILNRIRKAYARITGISERNIIFLHPEDFEAWTIAGTGWILEEDETRGYWRYVPNVRLGEHMFFSDKKGNVASIVLINAAQPLAGLFKNVAHEIGHHLHIPSAKLKEHPYARFFNKLDEGMQREVELSLISRFFLDPAPVSTHEIKQILSEAWLQMNLNRLPARPQLSADEQQAIMDFLSGAPDENDFQKIRDVLAQPRVLDAIFPIFYIWETEFIKQLENVIGREPLTAFKTQNNIAQLEAAFGTAKYKALGEFFARWDETFQESREGWSTPHNYLQYALAVALVVHNSDYDDKKTERLLKLVGLLAKRNLGETLNFQLLNATAALSSYFLEDAVGDDEFLQRLDELIQIHNRSELRARPPHEDWMAKAEWERDFLGHGGFNLDAANAEGELAAATAIKQKLVSDHAAEIQNWKWNSDSTSVDYFVLIDPAIPEAGQYAKTLKIQIENILAEIEDNRQEEYLAQWTRENPFVLGQITSARTAFFHAGSSQGFIGVHQEVFQDNGETARKMLQRLNTSEVMHFRPDLEFDRQPTTQENRLSWVLSRRLERIPADQIKDLFFEVALSHQLGYEFLIFDGTELRRWSDQKEAWSRAAVLEGIQKFIEDGRIDLHRVSVASKQRHRDVEMLEKGMIEIKAGADEYTQAESSIRQILSLPVPFDQADDGTVLRILQDLYVGRINKQTAKRRLWHNVAVHEGVRYRLPKDWINAAVEVVTPDPSGQNYEANLEAMGRVKKADELFADDFLDIEHIFQSAQNNARYHYERALERVRPLPAPNASMRSLLDDQIKPGFRKLGFDPPFIEAIFLLSLPLWEKTLTREQDSSLMNPVRLAAEDRRQQAGTQAFLRHPFPRETRYLLDYIGYLNDPHPAVRTGISRNMVGYFTQIAGYLEEQKDTRGLEVLFWGFYESGWKLHLNPAEGFEESGYYDQTFGNGRVVYHALERLGFENIDDPERFVKAIDHHDEVSLTLLNLSEGYQVIAGRVFITLRHGDLYGDQLLRFFTESHDYALPDSEKPAAYEEIAESLEERFEREPVMIRRFYIEFVKRILESAGTFKNPLPDEILDRLRGFSQRSELRADRLTKQIEAVIEEIQGALGRETEPVKTMILENLRDLKKFVPDEPARAHELIRQSLSIFPESSFKTITNAKKSLKKLQDDLQRRYPAPGSMDSGRSELRSDSRESGTREQLGTRRSELRGLSNTPRSSIVLKGQNGDDEAVEIKVNAPSGGFIFYKQASPQTLNFRQLLSVLLTAEIIQTKKTRGSRIFKLEQMTSLIRAGKKTARLTMSFAEEGNGKAGRPVWRGKSPFDEIRNEDALEFNPGFARLGLKSTRPSGPMEFKVVNLREELPLNPFVIIETGSSLEIFLAQTVGIEEGEASVRRLIEKFQEESLLAPDETILRVIVASRSELRTGADAPVLQSAPRVDRAELRQAARMPAVPESKDSGRSEMRLKTGESTEGIHEYPIEQMARKLTEGLVPLAARKGLGDETYLSIVHRVTLHLTPQTLQPRDLSAGLRNFIDQNMPAFKSLMEKAATTGSPGRIFDDPLYDDGTISAESRISAALDPMELAPLFILLAQQPDLEYTAVLPEEQIGPFRSKLQAFSDRYARILGFNPLLDLKNFRLEAADGVQGVRSSIVPSLSHGQVPTAVVTGRRSVISRFNVMDNLARILIKELSRHGDVLLLVAAAIDELTQNSLILYDEESLHARRGAGYAETLLLEIKALASFLQAA